MYGTVSELRQLLGQVSAGDANDDLMEVFLERATDTVDLVLGFSFADWPYAAEPTDKDVLSSGGQYLYLPACEAESVDKVSLITSRGKTTETTTEVEDWLAEETERPYRLYRADGWTLGAWYRVTANWGYGPAPVSVVQVTLELAVNLWRGKDRGMYSDVIGVEGGGAVGYQRALTNQQRMILSAVRARYGEVGRQ